jgi:hypothetical protein
VLNEREIRSLVAFSFGGTEWRNHDGNITRSPSETGKYVVTEFQVFQSLCSNVITSFKSAFGSIKQIESPS